MDHALQFGRVACRLGAWAPVLVGVAVLAGCDLGDIRRQQSCADGRDSAVVRIDGDNDFPTASARFPVGSGRGGYTAYATWDACHVYFGFEGAAFEEQGASPFRYLTLYVNVDPLGDDGVDGPRDYGPPRPKLPFKAEYLVEVRTDGRTGADGRYEGNVQFYHARSEWQAGLMESWRPQQTDGIEVAANPTTGYVEVAVERALLGAPCAVEVVGWVVDREADANLGFWPEPLAQPSAQSGPERGGDGSGEFVLADSLTLNYLGFELEPGGTPNASVNLNRTTYATVGDCAYGVRYDQ